MLFTSNADVVGRAPRTGGCLEVMQLRCHHRLNASILPLLLSLFRHKNHQNPPALFVSGRKLCKHIVALTIRSVFSTVLCMGCIETREPVASIPNVFSITLRALDNIRVYLGQDMV